MKKIIGISYQISNNMWSYRKELENNFFEICSTNKGDKSTV